MQEPNIPPLFQTLPKAESPLSFLETKRSAGAYKSYSRNQSRQNAMISGGLLKLNRAILLYISRVEKTGISSARIYQLKTGVFPILSKTRTLHFVWYQTMYVSPTIARGYSFTPHPLLKTHCGHGH
jgi:hypothetical protein